MAKVSIVELGRGSLYTRDTCLRKISRELELRVDQELEQAQIVVLQMLRAMYGDPAAVAIAAPQIGILDRIIVVDYEDRDTRNRVLEVLVNPKTISLGKETKAEQEICLSVPRLTGKVARATAIEVEAADQLGKLRRIVAEGFYARVLQHEIDHLDGVLYIDKLEGSLVEIPDSPGRRFRATANRLKLGTLLDKEFQVRR